MNPLSLLSIKHLFVIAILISSFYIKGQSSLLQFAVGTSFTNQQFVFKHEQKFQRWEPWIVNYPSIDANLKYSLGLGDKIGFVLGVGYSRFQVKYENSDYVDALRFYRDYKPIKSVRNYAIPQIGVSFQTSQKKKWSFFAEGTLNVALPFSCYDEKEFANFGRQKEELYKEDEFAEGLLMGPGLSAGLMLRPWRYGSNKNLSFSLSVNSRLFFFNQSDFSSNYTIGPSVGISYKL